MARSKSSGRWLNEHFADPFVRRAHAEGKRSRAAYKLEELMDRHLHLRPGMSIVDLGAAPGGWSQMAAEVLKGRGRILAMDILPMEPLDGVDFILGDFGDDAVLAQLDAHLDGAPVDLVMSDMAPNITGVAVVDQARSMNLAELALDFARNHLRPGGTFLVKLFQGQGFDAYLLQLRRSFDGVNLRKPKASRGRSKEIYALATGFKV